MPLRPNAMKRSEPGRSTGWPILLQQGMRRRHLNAQALAKQTGIRTPRIRVFAQAGARGPVHPTQAELAELAAALAPPLHQVLDAADNPETAPSV